MTPSEYRCKGQQHTTAARPGAGSGVASRSVSGPFAIPVSNAASSSVSSSVSRPILIPLLSRVLPLGAERAAGPYRSMESRREPATRTAAVVLGAGTLRHELVTELQKLRWSVREAGSASELLALLEEQVPSVAILDSWLPDLEIRACVQELGREFPQMDILAVDGAGIGAAPMRCIWKGELQHAIREATRRADAAPERLPSSQSNLDDRPATLRTGEEQSLASRNEQPRPDDRFDGPAWAYSPSAAAIRERHQPGGCDALPTLPPASARLARVPRETPPQIVEGQLPEPGDLPEFLGQDPRVREVRRRIRLVAHRATPVLVHGPTGSGKELVARALHRLSGRGTNRNTGKMIAVNCAAIPEALMEAELFGHTRGAFTGATQARIGRIEAAAGGTLFLDEIGEMPLAVQSKLLRFLESGELQRIGENEPIQVDVRVVAATHRKLGAMAAEGSFRLDLLHRLSVFLIQTPALAGRAEDLDGLIRYGLAKLGAAEPGKQLSREAQVKLHTHSWPGNVRELEHTLERAWILAGESGLIAEECIDFGEALL